MVVLKGEESKRLFEKTFMMKSLIDPPIPPTNDRISYSMVLWNWVKTWTKTQFKNIIDNIWTNSEPVLVKKELRFADLKVNANERLIFLNI